MELFFTILVRRRSWLRILAGKTYGLDMLPPDEQNGVRRMEGGRPRLESQNTDPLEHEFAAQREPQTRERGLVPVGGRAMQAPTGVTTGRTSSRDADSGSQLGSSHARKY